MPTQGLRVRICRDEEFARSGEYSHKYGGQPTFLDTLPNCDTCKRPLKLVFQFDLADPRLSFLDLAGLDYLPVLSCVDCDVSYGGQLFYVLHNESIKVLRNDGTESFEHWDIACSERQLTILPIPDDQQVEHYSTVEQWESHMMELVEPKHQLGGTPFWVQDEIEVHCCECAKKMRYLGQVDSETWPAKDSESLNGHMFGDMGMIYIHYCDTCRVIATGGDCH